MKNNYNPTYRPAGENVPTFVPVDSPDDGGTNNPNSGGPNSNSNGPTTPGTTTSPDDQQKPGDQGDKPSDQSQQTDPAGTIHCRTGQSAGSQNPSNPAGSLPGSDTRPGSRLDQRPPDTAGSGNPVRILRRARRARTVNRQRVRVEAFRGSRVA